MGRIERAVLVAGSFIGGAVLALFLWIAVNPQDLPVINPPTQVNPDGSLRVP